jgi:hypothetical protein
MAETAVSALRDYLRGSGGKKGKLIVLADAISRSDGKWVATGLESLLAEYQVRMVDERVLTLQGRNPTMLLAIVNPRSANPIAQSFASADNFIPFIFDDARPVEPASAGPSGAYTVETLVQTIPQTGIITEKDAAVSPVALVAQFRDRDNLEKLRERLRRSPVSLGVAVSETKNPSPPSMPLGHPPVNKDSVPRLLVFGDSSWISNQALNDRMGRNNYDLFLNCLSWLRERPDIGRQAEDKERQEYTLDLTEEAATRLRLLPSALMLLGVLGVAGGVWVVRRR